MSVNVDACLGHAEDLITRDGTEDLWLRGAVWLIRIALEYGIRDAWELRHPGSFVHGMRNQLLALPDIIDEEDLEVVELAAGLWDALSRAGHHHHYELAPTAAEVRDWLSGTHMVIERLRAPAAG